MKQCPHCAEEIQDAARVCKHCGRDLESGLSQVQLVQPKQKTGPIAGGCAVLLAAGVFVAIIGKCNEPPKPVITGQREAQAAAARAKAACDADPVCVAAREEKAKRAAKNAEQADAKVEAARTAVNRAVATLRAGGLVTRMDGGGSTIAGSRRVFVNGEQWRAMRVTDRELFVQTMSNYRQLSESLPQVTIHDDRSGHELASYGPLGGLKLE